MLHEANIEGVQIAAEEYQNWIDMRFTDIPVKIEFIYIQFKYSFFC